MRGETDEKGGDDELGGHAGELGGSDDTDSIIDLKKLTKIQATAMRKVGTRADCGKSSYDGEP